MEKWEYLTIHLERGEKKGKVIQTVEWEPEYMTQQLNEYGQQGWELVSQFCPPFETTFGTSGGAAKVFATFKRKVKR